MHAPVDPFLKLLLTRIDERLEQLGMKRREASLMAGLGPDFVREIGRGRQPSIYKTSVFATAIGVPLSWLIGDEIETAPANTNQRTLKELEAYLVQLDKDSISPLRAYICDGDKAAKAELQKLQDAVESAKAEMRR